jgi:adenine-specific DNA-methyltransferase
VALVKSTRRSANSDDRALGAVDTPKEIVDLMVELSEPDAPKPLRVLEPASGSCPFLRTLRDRRNGLEVTDEYIGVEVNEIRANLAASENPFAKVITGDFLLWDARADFDLVIGNPPYGIIGDPKHYPISAFRDTKPKYKRVFKAWRGKYNIYGAFIEKGLSLLRRSGRLVFVVPGTFMFLDDFSSLRLLMSRQGLIKVYYIGSSFPGKNVVAVVLVVEKAGKGLEVWDRSGLICRKSEYSGEMICFETQETVEFETGKDQLGRLFRIHFAARSPEIRRHTLTRTTPSDGWVPVLTGRNLKPGRINYENCHSGLWFPRNASRELRDFYSFPHIVVGHTKGSRVVAALDERCYPWREEFHLVPRWPDLNLQLIVDYLNSERVQSYLATLYRDISPHLTMRMLEALPVPASLGKGVATMLDSRLEAFQNPPDNLFRERSESLHGLTECGLLKSYEAFLRGVDLKSYREKYQRIKTVEQDLPRPLNPLPPIYNAYWLTAEHPSYEDFFSWYWDNNSKEIMHFIKQYFWGCSIEFVRQGFEARLYRTWVSLLTQFHLGYLWNCVSPGSFYASAELDMDGIDAEIGLGEGKAAIQVKKISYRREASQRRFSRKKLAGYSAILEVPYTVEDPDEITGKASRARGAVTRGIGRPSPFDECPRISP